MGVFLISDMARGKTRSLTDCIPLKIGQVVSYGDQGNSRQLAVVVGADPGVYGQAVVFVDDHHRGQVTRNIIDGAGGWKMHADIYDAQGVAELVALAAARDRDQQAKSEQAHAESAKRDDEGRAWLASNRPAWAKAILVATREENDCDSMTAYFATKRHESVALAWSKHTRDLFSEMRKAAATFPETAHLGPGLGVFTARVVQDTDGCASRWHLDLDGGVDDRKRFTTRAAADAFVAAAPTPWDIKITGAAARFSWEVSEQPIEHREKYSQGRGNYLKASGRYTDGWYVAKSVFYGDPAPGPFADPEWQRRLKR